MRRVFDLLNGNPLLLMHPAADVERLTGGQPDIGCNVVSGDA